MRKRGHSSVSRRVFDECTVHRVHWGGRVNGHCTHFLNVYYDALHFRTVSLKINIFKELVWQGGRGVTQKSTLCTFLIMLTVLEDP